MRKRRLRSAAGVALLLGTGLLFFVTPSARPGVGTALAAPAATCLRRCTPPPTDTPTPTCNPDNFPDCFLSPSPSIVVISPVPLDSPSPPSTPSYLIGTASPSPAPGADVGGTPIPLGGGFNDLPTPIPVVHSQSSSGGGGGGIPLPFLLLGFLGLVGGAGWAIYTYAPLGDRFPEPTPQSPGVMFTPYGPESPDINLLDPDIGRRSRARRPRANG